MGLIGATEWIEVSSNIVELHYSTYFNAIGGQLFIWTKNSQFFI